MTITEIVDMMLAETFSSPIISEALHQAGVSPIQSTYSAQAEKTSSEEPVPHIDR